MRVLITGGAGFIGSHLVEYFQGKAEVRVLDNFRSGCRSNLAGFQCELIEGSILDRAQVAAAVQDVDFVFHLAAMVSVPESVANPAGCEELNTGGTALILEESARAGVKKLVFSTSAAIYGDNPKVPKVETMPPEPKSPYATTKLAGEGLCQKFAAEGTLATTSLRYFNVFGPRQNPRSQYAAAVPIFIERALKGAPITIYGDGEQTRDFIDVQDIVAANVFFATQTGARGVFNIAYGQRMTINEVAQSILHLTHSKSEIRYAPERAGDVKHSMASIEKARQAGFVPQGSLTAGLERTIAFFKAQA
jgi:UDP-glucose 4-epimerase